MELLVKVGDKRYQADTNYAQGWRDGQIIDIRPDGFHKNPNMLKRMCLVKVPGDYWAIRGSIDLKSDKQSVMDFKKFLVPTDSNGKYPWEFGYLKDEKRIRCRDWFVDYQDLLDKGFITKSNYDSLYDFNGISNLLTIDKDFTTLLNHEDAKTRIKPFIKNMAVAAGTFTIGVAGDYATVTAAEADVDTALTGNLTFEHLDEETTISTAVTFDTETAGNLLKLTAASGAEHDGTAYGNGARINFAAGDALKFDETVADDLGNVEVSKLAIDASGNNNRAIWVADVGGVITINRNLIKGDANTIYGIALDGNSYSSIIINNIIYGIGDGVADSGLWIFTPLAAGPTVFIANNTIVKCYNNVSQERSGVLSYTMIFENNLCQDDTGGSDYRDDGSGFGTTAKNISEDATSPDVSYQSKDLHTNTIFNDYANDNYILDSGGDATNLAIVDDGENLYGSGVTEDIAGVERDNGEPFWAGASHIVAAVDVTVDESESITVADSETAQLSTINLEDHVSETGDGWGGFDTADFGIGPITDEVQLQ